MRARARRSRSSRWTSRTCKRPRGETTSLFGAHGATPHSLLPPGWRGEGSCGALASLRGRRGGRRHVGIRGDGWSHLSRAVGIAAAPVSAVSPVPPSPQGPLPPCLGGAASFSCAAARTRVRRPWSGGSPSRRATCDAGRSPACGRPRPPPSAGMPRRFTTATPQQHLVQPGELEAQHRAGFQQRTDHRRDEGVGGGQFPDAPVEAGHADGADLEAEVAQRAAKVVLEVLHLALQELARGEQEAAALARRRLDVHRLEQADAHHLG
jgi:hypothetical protein